MSKEVVIKISATDAASPVFKKLAGEAAAAGASIETTNEKAGRSYDDLQKRATAVGAGIGAVVGAMSLAGTAAYNQNREIDALTRVYGKSADELIRFTNEIQRNTNFSNDQGRQAALISATLVNSYGLQADQVEKLIARSADLATVYGITLADAVQRTSSAVRGEAESAELLGITLNDNYVAAQAAARGMTGWTTTMTDAEKAAFRYQLILEQTANLQGTAAAQAEGARGKMIDLKDSVQDNVAAFGDWLGPMGEALSSLGSMALVLPVVTGLVGKMGAALGAAGLGASGFAALALLAGSGAYAYDLNTNSGGWAANATTSALAGAAGALNWALPGDPFADVQQQFLDLKDKGNFEAALNAVYMNVPGNNVKQDENYWIGVLITSGVLPVGWSGSMTDAAKYIASQATATGVSNQQYVTGKLNTSETYTYDPVSQTYVPNGYLPTLKANRYFALGGNLTSGATTMGYGTLANQAAAANQPYGSWSGDLPFGLGAMNAYQRGGGGAVANDLYNLPSNRQPVQALADSTNLVSSGATTSLVGAYTTAATQQDAADAAAYTRALVEMYGAYAGLVEGINSASDAQSAFKATQDGLITQENVYGQQISEYSGQLDAMSAAYDILNKRKEDGTALTKEETDFLNNYAEAQARGTAGVEDATVAQGLLAEQYLLNMEKGDAMNAALQGTTDATESLVVTIDRLILSMSGIPDEVRTAILLDLSDESIQDLINYLNYLNSIPGSVSTVVETVYVESSDGSGGRYRGAAGMNGLTAYADGGTVYDPLMPRYAGGGTVAMVGERGPEMVWLPRGAQVSNTEATKSRMQSGMRGGNNIFNGPVTLQMNTPDVYDALSSDALGGAR